MVLCREEGSMLYDNYIRSIFPHSLLRTRKMMLFPPAPHSWTHGRGYPFGLRPSGLGSTSTCMGTSHEIAHFVNVYRDAHILINKLLKM